jgi:hypothetical protein
VVVADSVALARIASEEPGTLRELALATLTHPNNLVRFGGLGALTLADPTALKPILPSIKKLKDDSSAPIRELASELAGKVEKAPKADKK